MSEQPRSAISAVLDRRRFLQLGLGSAIALGVGWPSSAPAGPAGPWAPARRRLPGVADHDAAVALAWFDLAAEAVRTTPGFTPPVAARLFGHAGVALYEAVVAGMPAHRSLAGQLDGLDRPPDGRPSPHRAGRSGRRATGHRGGPPLSWPLVANGALGGILRRLLPPDAAAQPAVDELERRILTEHRPAVGGPLARRSHRHGVQVAEAVFAWSRSDGGHEGYRRNFPAGDPLPAGPGRWEPTPPAFQPPMQPTWGSNRTMVPGLARLAGAEPPLRYSEDPSSAFHRQAVEVRDTVAHLSDEQLAVARFWSDDPGATATPAGHSISILSQVLATTQADLGEAAEAYARVGIALSDAFVCCWATKYRYRTVRPVTYIRRHVDPGWGDPLPLTTPPFPEHTSGHSVQSAAAAEVLTARFGPMAFVDHTHDRRGLPPRRFGSFSEAAAEAAISRLYGGIHFRRAIEAGLRQGTAVGVAVNRLRLEV